MKQCRGQMSMFSAEASLDPASRFPSPGSEEARRMTVTSGLKCLELYRNSGPLGSLVRTLLGSSIWRSTRCTLTWKTKVTPSNRLLFRLVPSTPRTGGTDAPLWLGTPTAGTGTHGRSEKWRKGKTPNPQEYVMMFPTPKATDYKGSGPAGSKSAEHDLKKGSLKGTVMYLEQGNGGQLNPDWVEWLMGFPIGWTEI